MSGSEEFSVLDAKQSPSPAGAHSDAQVDLESTGEAGGITVTKAELSDLLYERVGLNKREARDVVDAFFNEVRDTLIRGDGLKLSGFGHFQLRDKPQRPGRNPRTGESIPITARRVVTFHASQKLKALIQDPTAQVSDLQDDSY